MKNALVGSGWPFPIVPDAGGGLSYVDGDTNVEQSLKILFLTDLGERVMRPDFGCRAPRLVFAPGSVQSLSLLETTIREAVRDWEPREDVQAEPDLKDPTRVIVSVGYLVRQTNTPGNLVFPFYVGTVETP
jgi:phage baseplate assembly protein W